MARKNSPRVTPNAEAIFRWRQWTAKPGGVRPGEMKLGETRTCRRVFALKDDEICEAAGQCRRRAPRLWWEEVRRVSVAWFSW